MLRALEILVLLHLLHLYLLLFQKDHVQLLLRQGVHLLYGPLLVLGHIREGLLEVQRCLRHLLVHRLLHLLHLLVLHLLVKLELLLHLLVLHVRISIIKRVRAVPVLVHLPIIALSSTITLLPSTIIERPHLILVIKRGDLSLIKIYHFLASYSGRALDWDHLTVHFIGKG